MKLFKNKFFTSTFILILSGLATKGLGLIIKIIFTRLVGSKTIGLYSLVMPTYSLLLTICSLAMPTTIASLIAKNKNSKIISSALIIIIVLNFIVIFIMHLISPFIANILLKEKDTYYLLIAMSYTLPFASIACILKGYFYGIQKMIPHVISNLIEQIIRIILVITIIPYLIKISYVYAAAGLIFTSFITELASIIVFLCFLKKEERIIIKKIDFNKTYAKDILDLSLPTVSSRIFGNICYFLEPIILTNILLYKGFSNNYIITQYGAYNVYAIGTLTIPSFFINAISLALIPEISKNYKYHNYRKIKERLWEGIIFSLIIGFIFITTIYHFRYKLLLFLYHTNYGADYIKYLSPIFILFYLESIFSSFMQGINKVNITFKITIISSSIKLLTLTLLAYLKLGIYSLLISEIINIILVVLLNLFYIFNFFHKKRCFIQTSFVS